MCTPFIHRPGSVVEPRQPVTAFPSCGPPFPVQQTAQCTPQCSLAVSSPQATPGFLVAASPGFLVAASRLRSLGRPGAEDSPAV